MPDAVLDTDFIKEMVRQMRAFDTHGVSGARSPEEVLAPFILTAEARAELPIVGDPDEETMMRVRVFYNAIAVLIEKECGLMASPFMQLSHEGFGRVLITVGKLVAVEKTLRDMHRFGFDSLSRMKTESDKLLSVALERIGSYPAGAGL